MKRLIKHTGIQSGESGFSLVEIIITIVVAGIVMVSALPFLKITVNSYVGIKAQKDLMQSARIGFNRMIADMNDIEASIQIDYGYTNAIQFDLSGDDDINYRFSDGELQRKTQKLVAGVQSLVFRYYREDGVQKGTPFSYDSDVWRIQIEMNVGTGDSQMVFRGSVSPRNIHYD